MLDKLKIANPANLMLSEVFENKAETVVKAIRMTNV
jgi:hypothetical protein